MNINKEIERLEKFKAKMTTSCWLTSQMRLNLERAYATKEERERILKIIKDWKTENTDVLKTKDIVSNKIIIANYFKWNQFDSLINSLIAEEPKK